MRRALQANDTQRNLPRQLGDMRPGGDGGRKRVEFDMGLEGPRPFLRSNSGEIYRPRSTDVAKQGLKSAAGRPAPQSLANATLLIAMYMSSRGLGVFLGHLQ